MLSAEMGTWLSGLVWALFCGLAIGNYATNPIYRLPRNEPLFGRKPYCGDCNAELKPKDLFPILSWLSTMGKCRYCGAGVPVAYVVAEFLITVLFVLTYVQYGFGDEFLLIGMGGTALIMIVMMEVIDRFFSNITWLFFLVTGALLRAMHEQAISGASYGAFYASLLPLVYWWFTQRRKTPDSKLPDYIKLWAAAGVWLAPQALIVFALAWVIFDGLVRILSCARSSIRSALPLSATYAAALLILVIYPKIAKLI